MRVRFYLSRGPEMAGTKWSGQDPHEVLID